MNRYTIPAETRRLYALVGPLSFLQSLLLGGAGLMVWRLGNGSLPLPLRAALMATTAVAGVLLTFGRWPLGEAGEPLGVWAARILRYLRQPRRWTVCSRVEGPLPVQAIRSATIRVPGAAVRILEVGATPFELRDAAEREAVLAGYRAFLNLLPGPVQIVTVCERLRLDGFLDGLRGRADGRHGLMRRQIQAHVRFVERLLAARHILTRRHYVVLRRPRAEGAAAWETAVKQLGQDEAVIASALQQMGLSSRPLTNAELARLLRSAFVGRPEPLPAEPEEFTAFAVVSARHA